MNRVALSSRRRGVVRLCRKSILIISDCSICVHHTGGGRSSAAECRRRRRPGDTPGGKTCIAKLTNCMREMRRMLFVRPPLRCSGLPGVCVCVWCVCVHVCVSDCLHHALSFRFGSALLFYTNLFSLGGRRLQFSLQVKPKRALALNGCID